MVLIIGQYRRTAGGKLAAFLAGIVLLFVVVVFFAFGFVLVLGLGAAGLLLGIGAALVRRLTGRPAAAPEVPQGRHGLDPSLEVSPPPRTLDRPE